MESVIIFKCCPNIFVYNYTTLRMNPPSLNYRKNPNNEQQIT